MRAVNLKIGIEQSTFEVYGTEFKVNLAGEFNILNCLAALATGAMKEELVVEMP